MRGIIVVSFPFLLSFLILVEHIDRPSRSILRCFTRLFLSYSRRHHPIDHVRRSTHRTTTARRRNPADTLTSLFRASATTHSSHGVTRGCQPSRRCAAQLAERRPPPRRTLRRSRKFEVVGLYRRCSVRVPPRTS